MTRLPGEIRQHTFKGVCLENFSFFAVKCVEDLETLFKTGKENQCRWITAKTALEPRITSVFTISTEKNRDVNGS